MFGSSAPRRSRRTSAQRKIEVGRVVQALRVRKIRLGHTHEHVVVDELAVGV